MSFIFSSDDIIDFFKNALIEDCPIGDITTEACIDSDDESMFRIIAKEEQIAIGAQIAVICFKYLDDNFNFEYLADDGDRLQKGDLLLQGRGKVSQVLLGERPVLNLLQRLAGVVMNTQDLVKSLGSSEIKLLDTRKTTPGLRCFEKYAVAVGGGKNHRKGLSDRFLIKENHMASNAKKEYNYIRIAIKKCREYRPNIPVEIEVKNIEEAIEAEFSGADIIMLDNMTPEQVKECIKALKGKSKIEVSGGITFKNIKKYNLPGVDYISCGALTHHVRSMDLSLLIEDKV